MHVCMYMLGMKYVIRSFPSFNTPVGTYLDMNKVDDIYLRGFRK